MLRLLPSYRSELMKPAKTALAIYGAMKPYDRGLVACLPFREGRFTGDGDIICGCIVCEQGGAVPQGMLAKGYGSPTRWEPCWNLEFLCEVMAAIILVPKPTHDCSLATAARYGTEPSMLRFRQAIGRV